MIAITQVGIRFLMFVSEDNDSHGLTWSRTELSLPCPFCFWLCVPCKSVTKSWSIKVLKFPTYNINRVDWFVCSRCEGLYLVLATLQISTKLLRNCNCEAHPTKRERWFLIAAKLRFGFWGLMWFLWKAVRHIFPICAWLHLHCVLAAGCWCRLLAMRHHVAKCPGNNITDLFFGSFAP